MKLADAFSLIRNGVSIKQYDNATGYPITRIGTISNRVVDRNKCGYADVFDIGKYQDYVLQDGDILLSHINSVQHLGKTALYTRVDDEVLIHGMNLLVLRPKQEILEPNYAYIALNSLKFLRQLPRITKKSVNQASISVSDLKEVDIDVPPLSKQREITRNVMRIDRLIDNRQQTLSVLGDLVKSRFVEMFGDPMTNPMRWEIRNFGDIISKAETGWSGNGTQRKKVSGELAVLKISAVTSGQFREDEYKVLDDQENIKKKVFPRKGCLIVSRANTKDLVGASVLVEKDYDDLILPDKLWQFKFEKNVNVHYMKAVMSHEFIRSMVSQSSTGTSGSMYNISMEKYKMIEIPLPPAQLQDQFADFVALTDKSKLAVQQSIEMLQTLKEKLMQDYFG